jgi:hypothetical protein
MYVCLHDYYVRDFFHFALGSNDSDGDDDNDSDGNGD